MRKQSWFVFSPMVIGLFSVIISLIVSFIIIETLGYTKMPLVLMGILSLTLLLYASSKDQTNVAIIWFIAMSGFQRTGMLRMPGLPDFSYARLFLVWVMFLLLMRFIVQGKKPKGPYLADVAFILYSVYLVIQLSFHDIMDFHKWYLSTLTPLIAYLFAKNIFNKDNQVKHFFWVLLIPSFYFSVTSIAEHFSWDFLVWPKTILDTEYGNTWAGRSRGPFHQTAVFGAVMGMLVITHLYLLTVIKKMNLKILVSIVIILSLLGIFYTFTRSCWISVTVGLIAVAVLRPRFRIVLVSMLIGGIIVASAGVLQSSDSALLQERFSNTRTIENRLSVLSAAAQMFADHPFFGIGYYQFDVKKELYLGGVDFPVYGYIKAKSGRDVAIHDIYIGRAAEEGLVGLSLLFLYVIGVFKSFIKKWKFNPQEEWFNRNILAIYMGVIVAYLFGGLFIDLRFFDLPNTIPAFFAGLITGYANDRIT